MLDLRTIDPAYLMLGWIAAVILFVYLVIAWTTAPEEKE